MLKLTQILLFPCLLLSFSCQAQVAPLKEIRFPNGKICLLLDSVDAGKAITTDRYDGYFDKVNVSEMSIQMQQPIDPGKNRAAVLQDYVQYLKTDVESFTAEEASFVEGIIKKVYQTSTEVAPYLFPDTLKLIKTKGRHYGDGVWYTRDNCIIIPADELGRKKTVPFRITMYHELSHVWSRLNPKQSDQAYKLIGFEGIGFQNLLIPPALAERVLYNPDGVDIAQKITLKQENGTEIYAIPIIYANNKGWTETQKTFFAYLEFNLFQIEKQEDGKWKVLVKDDGFSSVIDLKAQPDFFRQIKDNTGYIIHPDEVLADNFAFIMQERNGQKVSLSFSAEGKKLLTDLEAVLRGK
ncbi:MAG: hypothetical protein J0M29_17345 [Chitinophagales bacterium]|nr:hypothetical protein [Chitinophagales bacterium]